MKHHYLPTSVLDNTSEVHFIIVGAGGTGSHLTYKMAKIALALKELGRKPIKVTLVDGGEIRNTTHFRGNFSPFVREGNKAVNTIEYVNRLFKVDFKSLDAAIAEATTYMDIGLQTNQCVFFITCTDTISSRAATKSILENFSKLYKFSSLYWMDIGNDKDFGQYILGTVGKIEQPYVPGVKTIAKMPLFYTFFEEYFKRTDSNTQSCNFFETVSSQELLINDIMATHAAYMIYDFLINYNITYQGAFINMETLTINPIML